MPFEKKCGCSNASFCPKDGQNLRKIDGKRIRVAVIKKLQDMGVLSTYANFLCDGCIKYTEALLLEETSSKRKKSTLLGEVMEKIERDEFTQTELEELTKAIGRKQSKDIYKDSVEAGKVYKDDDALKHFDPSNWIKERNGCVLAFFEGLMEEKFSNMNFSMFLVNALEAIYQLRNPNFVGPLAFARSLLVYSKTGSKEAVSITSACSPSGSYTSILNWLKDHSTDKISCPSNSDFITFFDNNQVIGRKWRVKNDFKASSSVITSVAHMETNSNIQTLEHYAPSSWQCYDTTSKQNFVKNIKRQEEVYEKQFDGFRKQFLAKRLQEVANQQKKVNNCLEDHMDGNIDPPCETPPPDERYTYIASGHKPGPSKVIAGEPIFENPCSYEAVEKVLDHLMEEAKVGDARRWTAVGCDGLPYILASRLIEEIFICPLCRRQYDGRAEFLSHINETHHTDNSEDGRKYKDVLMLTGMHGFHVHKIKVSSIS
ncbi:uncharacterized protein LOC133175604 [Saccostrea echinata]|uniref:uncharacterized protein LOC133175604 n=1 Tax=Saccostrea echinata TaxID=191078 RepID=UPI002A7FC649|nr:uncharacterized protein LOC133175604 [Saccostrea echinata]